jgi:Polyketide cyclase / dehydrase and lipid transport
VPRVLVEREITARQDRVFAFLANYADGRPRLLTSDYVDYCVEKGGQGAGTVISYRFRERPYFLRVETPAANTLLERDTVSSLVTTWRVMPAPNERSIVRVVTEWRGSGGVGGVFERVFAPRGLRRVYEEVLERLEGELAG